MKPLSTLLACCATLACSLVCASTHAADWLHDPVVTFTNGMPLASATSLRSHHYRYQCNPYHFGSCDGRMQSPCREANASSWRHLTQKKSKKRGCRSGNGFLPEDGAVEHAQDGMEGAGGESLGTIPAGGPGGGGGAFTAVSQDLEPALPSGLNTLLSPAAGIALPAAN